MALQKNVASQRWIVFAWTIATNVALAGDAAQITANLRLDGGAANAIDDTNPAELEDGYYAFDLSQAETNADNIAICPVSSTSGVAVIGCPMACWTDSQAALITTVGTAGAGIADAVWDELMAGHVTAATFGLLQCLLGKWEITSNQLKLYDLAGTLKYTFDLTRDGSPTEFNADLRSAV